MYNADEMENESSKGTVLAVDWGSKRLGLAVSDPTHTLARPLPVIEHISREKDVERILLAANDNLVETILVGVNYNDHNEPTPSGRSAMRLLAAIENSTSIDVIPWDETGSTRTAVSSRLEMGIKRNKRSGHHDSIAAVVFLQNYLDNHSRIK